MEISMDKPGWLLVPSSMVGEGGREGGQTWVVAGAVFDGREGGRGGRRVYIEHKLDRETHKF